MKKGRGKKGKWINETEMEMRYLFDLDYRYLFLDVRI